jgi:hypothetical protein
VGETIDQTRLEIAAQRTQIEATVDEVRQALDLRQRVRENPGLVIGLGVAAIFLLVGGPRRLARGARRRSAADAGQKAFVALPDTLQAWVDTLAEAAGPDADQVRGPLAEELAHWRRQPIKDRKAREALARQMVDGSPGPSRAAWKAAEVGLTLLSAAMARRAIERFLTNESRQPGEEADGVKPQSSPKEADAAYSGFSGLGRGDAARR